MRRTFSDGKRQRLEDLIPSMIDSLERWSVAVKAKREERVEWKRNWEEQERRRKDHERQARVEGYRITFLQRQIERKREIDGLADLIDLWSAAEDPDPKFAELLEFARIYRKWLEATLVDQFFRPALSQSNDYWRAVGYFSSSALGRSSSSPSSSSPCRCSSASSSSS